MLEKKIRKKLLEPKFSRVLWRCQWEIFVDKNYVKGKFSEKFFGQNVPLSLANEPMEKSISVAQIVSEI